MNHLRAAFLVVATVAADLAAAACAAPPVTTQDHAVCIAREFVIRSGPKWEVAYQADPTPTAWVVHYAPASSNIRGGAGALEIERLTGRVNVREALR